MVELLFQDHQTTVYVVIDHRARSTVTATLGENFPGVLVSDCLAIYEGVNPHQQKCYRHHFRALDRAVERQPQQASPWLDSVRLLLRTAMILAPLRAASEPVAWALVLVGAGTARP